MESKIQKILKSIVQIISGIIAIFVLVTLLFTRLNKVDVTYDLTDRFLIEDYVNNFVLVMIIGVFVLIWRRNKLGQKNPFKSNYWKIYLVLASIILLAVQIGFVYHTYFYAGNDAFNLRIGAEYFVNKEWNSFYNLEYFQGCPNNLMAYIIYIFAYSLAKNLGCDGYLLLVGCNIILANAAVLMSALSVYKLTESKNVMWLVYIASVLLFGVSPWLSVPYTDMMSIVTPIMSFYIYLCLRDRAIPDAIKWFFILFTPFFMYGLKPLNIIIGIAIILCELLYFRVSKDIVKQSLSFLVAGLMILLIVFGVQTSIEKYVRYQADEDKVLAFDWVLFLGSDYKTYGQWSYENFQFALQFQTKEERQEKLLEAVVERVSEMGVQGYLSHLMNKTHVFYDDGNFGWGTTGGVVLEIPERENVISNVICNIVYPPENYGFVSNYPGYGENFKYYAVAKQGVWLFVFCFMVIGLCRPTKDKKLLILKISWIGVFLFTMLFEAHARLLISFLPIFVVTAGMGAFENNNVNKLIQKDK